ncbi:hypothetical protein SDC9_152491 [bioreactor metagenome]|uniref:Uncharacterized protein n=1 Tax=bioreactor metagenome TaxID=1076179 RepID=A0A645ET71_9ZZZZ
MRPLEGIEHAFRDIGNETGRGEQRVLGVGALAKHLARAAQIKLHQVAGVIVNANVILGVGCFGDVYLLEHQVKFAVYQGIMKGIVVDLVLNVGGDAIQQRPGAGRFEAAIVERHAYLGIGL